jgi:hypothetical protein
MAGTGGMMMGAYHRAIGTQHPLGRGIHLIAVRA